MKNSFKLLIKEEIEDIKSKGYIYMHTTGLTVAYIKNKDVNRVFSITFKTPPIDNTGVAHILEHCVLAGSNKYPLKDPFNELLKSKLYSYLNAITFKDKTMYPIGSYNEEELFTMADVYLDAVFNPLILTRKETFLQEGWHYNLNEKINYNGIVYNEMRSIYSDTSYLIKRVCYRGLFPNTVYKYDSAGNPESIPNLTYDNFIKYYKDTYLPQNALIFLYGDLNISNYLNHINIEYLKAYNYNESKLISLNLQESFKKPKFIYDKSYSLTNTHLCVAFAINTVNNVYLVHFINILTKYLLEFEVSPLRQELIKIGESVSYEFEIDLPQPTLFIILKNAKKDINTFKYIILKCIENIVNNFMDKELLDTSINKYEFEIRKEDYGYKPKGLGYNIDMISSFMYNTPSFKSLNKISILNNIKKEKDNIVKILDKYILNNNHCVYTTLKGEKRNKILPINKNINLKQIYRDLSKLKAYEQLEDDKSIVNKISSVNISNLGIAPIKDIINVKEINGFRLIHNHVDLNNVISLGLCFNINCIPKDLLPYIGLYTILIGKLGTKNYKYNELSKKINYYFGYISTELNIYPNIKTKTCESNLELKIQFLETNINNIEELIKEIILNTDFNNPKLIKYLIKEHKIKMENYYKSEGHILAKERVKINFSNEYKKREVVLGLEFYDYINNICKDFNYNWENILYNLKTLNRRLFIKQNFKVISTSHKHLLYKIEDFVSNIYICLSGVTYTESVYNVNSINATTFITNTSTNFNAMGFSFLNKGYKYSAKLEVIATILNTTYLYNEIRIKGGAYGAYAEVSKEGYIILYSLRDPNTYKTIETFKNISNFLKEFKANKNEMIKYILATINLLYKPIHKYKMAERGLNNFLCGITHKELLAELNDILDTKVKDINDFGEIIDNSIKTNFISSVGNKNIMNKNNYII